MCSQQGKRADSSWESSLKGSIAALYADPSHNAGILKGSLTGSACLQLNAWEAEGTWLPVPLASEISNMDATQFRDDQYGIIRTFDSYRSYCDEDMPSATTAAGGQIQLGVLGIRTSYIDHPALYVDDPNNPGGRPAWGIVQTLQGGSYDMTTTPLGNFGLNFSYLPDNNMAGQIYFLSYTQNDGLFSPDKGGILKEQTRERASICSRAAPTSWPLLFTAPLIRWRHQPGRLFPQAPGLKRASSSIWQVRLRE